VKGIRYIRIPSASTYIYVYIQHFGVEGVRGELEMDLSRCCAHIEVCVFFSSSLLAGLLGTAAQFCKVVVLRCGWGVGAHIEV